MADPLNPIAAEFGEQGDIHVPGPVKPVQEVDHSDAFKKEMEKKARTVNEKEREDNRSEAQTEHEMAVLKPLIKEAIDKAQSELGSVLDVQTSTSDTQVNTSQPSNQTPKKSVVVTNSSDTSSDLSQGNDNLTSKLPAPPPSSGKEKVEIEHTAKKMAPPPLTTPVKEIEAPPPSEKKATTSVQMASSSEQGDSSSKERQQAPVLPKTMDATAQKPAEKIDTQLKPTAHKITQAPLPTPSKTPLLEAPAPKPLVTTEAPLHKIDVKPLSSNLPLQENKPSYTPPIGSSTEMTSSLEKTSEMKTEPSTPQSTETPDLSPLDLAQKDDSVTSSPFVVPFPQDVRKKDDIIKTSKEEKEGPAIVQEAQEADFSGDEKNPDSKEQQNQMAAGQTLLDSIFPTDRPDTAFKEAIGFDKLHPHILDLFDRMVGVITVLQVQGKTETTIHLNEKQSPLLQGAEVTITCFDTARQSYNIELRGPPQAVAIFGQNLEQLKKSFQKREADNKTGKKEFDFKINDIRISLKEEKNK